MPDSSIDQKLERSGCPRAAVTSGSLRPPQSGFVSGRTVPRAPQPHGGTTIGDPIDDLELSGELNRGGGRPTIAIARDVPVKWDDRLASAQGVASGMDSPCEADRSVSPGTGEARRSVERTQARTPHPSCMCQSRAIHVERPAPARPFGPLDRCAPGTSFGKWT